ncbi:LPS assembly protein LptD [Aliivibrio kagoshimensis]|uniref:LPS assembly protein LptD n=1 Tax=Aliivibrio kagoshimensis TaxID=2910230 RepID=UPI003D0C7239
MSFTSRSLLATMIGISLTSTAALANNSATEKNANQDDKSACQQPENYCATRKAEKKSASQTDSKQLPVTIEADSVESSNNNRATYQGNVIITQGPKTVEADKITLHQPENIVTAEGNVVFTDADMITTSDKVITNLDTEDSTMTNAQFELRCENSRGEAAHIFKSGKAIYKMEDGSFTTCPIDDNSWQFSATSIEYDESEEWAHFYNARFEVLDVPIFYTPYLTVPVGDTRKTGLLIPSIKLDSKNGLELSVPIYWNLAENYDATTTINYMEKRGTQFLGEFRYMIDAGQGSFDLEYLSEDKAFLEQGTRWASNWSHSGIYQESWKFSVDYTQVSDIDYFRDLNSSIGSREDGQLLQSAEASYRVQNWDTTVRIRDFQVLDDATKPYRLMPQVEFNYYAPQFFNELDFNLLSHVSRLETDDTTKPSATRLHIEPALRLPFAAPGWSVTSEAKMMYTYYQQEFDDTITELKELEEEANRFVPEFKTSGTLYFERPTFIIDDYLQTLEPQIQYLYVQDVEQDDIYSGYDSTLLQTDYYGLFRSRKYSGVDYIAPANQISVGATTRFLDDQYRERMNIAFGQIYYFEKSSTDNSTDSDKSAWAIETDFNYDDYLFYHGGLQYDSNLEELQLLNNTIEYRHNKGYVQLNYRYVTKDYISKTVAFIDRDSNQYTEEGISQAGFLTAFDVNKSWSVKGQYFYDTNEDITIESLAGVTYLSDCWSFGLTYSYQLRDWPNGVGTPTPGPEYESNIGFTVGIRGLGNNTAVGSSDGGNALGYGRPFYLNN